METGLQPCAQTRFGRGEIDAADPDLGESQLPGPAAQALEQLLAAGWLRPMPDAPEPAVIATSPHGPILGSRSLRWADEAACAASAVRLARAPGIADASIELRGELGAGKTSFVRHLLRARGVPGRIKSPSYAVLESHLDAEGGVASHFDFYRFDDPQEWADAGFREIYAAPGLKLAEWPERVAALLPPPDLRLWIAIEHDQSRRVEAAAGSTRGLALLEAL